MSLRLEMLQVARLAPKVLGESSHLVREFLQRQQNLDGGFKDRSGRSDLYYTVFGLDGCVALQKDFNALQVESYLSPFGNGEGLDFVHLCCLARCWAAVGRFSSAFTDPCLKRIEGFRSADGGYNPVEGSSSGTAYGCFLAMGAYQDLGEPLPEPTGISHCLQTLQTDDGAWANESGVRRGATNATAAAVTLLRCWTHDGTPAADYNRAAFFGYDFDVMFAPRF